MRNTLICTVGTSFFVNINEEDLLDKEAPDAKRRLVEAYKNERWSALANEILKLRPDCRLCGAEINTIEEVVKRKKMVLERIFFLVSDTPQGKNTGEFLKRYYEQRRDLELKSVDYVVVERLQDKNPKDFKIYGLRNLVRCIGDIVHRIGGHEFVAIDATGGYKAQIAIATIIGQVMDIPVFYKHEHFNEIIDFPPLPVSFDYRVLAENSYLLSQLEKDRALTGEESGQIEEKLKVLLTENEIDGEILYQLSAIGQIYIYGFRRLYPRPPGLHASETRKEPTFRQDNYPIGFQEFVKKIWQENDWIITANSIGYEKQKSIKGTGFHIDRSQGQPRLIGTYTDKDNFGARFWLHLSDETEGSLAWAVDHLNSKYGS